MVGQRTVEVADVFDVRAARALSEAVALLAAGERVIVDCRGVRHFEDRALPLLAEALRDRAGQVSLRGLGEHQWRVLGYLGGNLIWVGFFEWTWKYFGAWLKLEPVTDKGIPILMPGLLMIQATSLIVIVLLIFFGANKDTRCRMFMWFHRNLRLRPGRMTAGYQRQHSRTTAIETVFLIWFIYLCAITINDPRLIRYDSIAAMVITVGFVIWGLYLANKLTKIRGLGAAFRYAIPTGNILWLPIEGFSRWGLYPEVWVKPIEYSLLMAGVLVVFVAAGVVVFRSAEPRTTGAVAAA